VQCPAGSRFFLLHSLQVRGLILATFLRQCFGQFSFGICFASNADEQPKNSCPDALRIERYLARPASHRRENHSRSLAITFPYFTGESMFTDHLSQMESSA
jgi:hypothetical protein